MKVCTFLYYLKGQIMYKWIAAKSELQNKIWAGAQILSYNSLSSAIQLYMIRAQKSIQNSKYWLNTKSIYETVDINRHDIWHPLLISYSY